MLKRMWKIPSCRNMYVTGCQIARCSTMSAGCRPSLSLIAGTISDTRNAPTLAAMSILIAGVNGPGPKEYANDDEDGNRDRMNFSVLQQAATQQHLYPHFRPPRPPTRSRGCARICRQEVAP